MTKRKKFFVAAVILFLVWIAAGQDLRTERTPFKTAVRSNFAALFAESLSRQFLPVVAWRDEPCGGAWLAVRQIEGILPLYGMARRGLTAAEEPAESAIWEDDRHSVVLEYEEVERKGTQASENTGAEGMSLQELLREENEAVAESEPFTPHEKRMQVDLEDLKDYETLVGTFYTVDANTMAGSDQLNLEALLGRDMTVQRAGNEPQILIYHTHSQEGFADSVPGDPATTIMGVGEHLADILREKYGYSVLHHTGQYDVDSRNDAYGKALPELERILAEHPSIEVVIDLHRDQMPEDTRLVMSLDGMPTARFMFFNGLSRTKKTGDISYLQNPNIADNLAFSFQMELKAQEYYPGLTRKIYLKGYRYNMHLRPKSLLVELGAQNNTLEEAMNACGPLAHLLDMVLGGEGT